MIHVIFQFDCLSNLYLESLILISLSHFQVVGVQRVNNSDFILYQYLQLLQKVQREHPREGHLLPSMTHCTQALLGKEGDIEKEHVLWHGANWGMLFLILQAGFKGTAYA